MCGGMCAGKINSGRKPEKKKEDKPKEQKEPKINLKEWELGGP